MDIDSLKKKLKEVKPPLRGEMVEKKAVLSISRGLFYYRPAGLTDLDLKRMEKMDELFTENPTRGTRRLSKALKKRFGLVAGRDKVRHLMDIMGISAIYPEKNLSIANRSHKKYPYRLRGLSITRTDQGCQYTSEEFTGILKSKQIKISMDGKGRALGNVFVERLWRTVKQEEVYLKGYRNVLECRESLSHYFDLYNTLREHQSLDDNDPAEIYKGEIELKKAA